MTLHMRGENAVMTERGAWRWRDLARGFLPCVTAPLARPLWIASVTAASVIAVFSLVSYPLFQLIAFGDGALFSLAALSDSPWHFFWQSFATRATAYLISGLLPSFVLEATGQPGWTLATYAILFGGMPLFSLAGAYLALPAGEKRQITWPCLWFSAVGMLTFGFPTETWIMAAVFWPLLFVLRYRRGPWSLLGAGLLSLAFAFSHESFVLCLPVLLLAARPGEGMLARWAIVICATAALFAVKNLVVPVNVQIISAVANNAANFLSAMKIAGDPIFLRLALGAVLGAAAVFAWNARTWRGSAARLAVLAGLALAIAAVVFANLDEIPTTRYLARTLVAIALPCFGMAALMVRFVTPATVPNARENDSAVLRLPDWAGAAAVAASLAMAAVHLAHAGAFVARFSALRADLRAMAGGAVQPPPESDYRLVPRSAGAPKAVDPAAWELTWYWATPFLTVLSAKDFKPRHLVVHANHTYSPMLCGDERLLSRLPAETVAMLKDYTCRIANNGEPP
jgi:hypothetical protein